jgi:thioredoxin 1
MIKIIQTQDELQTSTGITIVDFYADWCGPCKMMLPVLEQLDQEFPEVTILKVDADSFPELMLKNEVVNIPTLDIYENGEKKIRKVGYLPKPLLLKDLETYTTIKRRI